MKIKMRTTAAGPNGNMIAGHVYSVRDDEGKALVAGGYASIIIEVSEKPAERKSVEAAVVSPPESARMEHAPKEKPADRPRR